MGVLYSGKVIGSDSPQLPSFIWEKVAEINVDGVSSIEFTELSGDEDKYYLIIGYIANPTTTSTGGIFAQFNGDTNIGRYAWLTWVNANGIVTTAKQLLGQITGVPGAVAQSCGASTVVFCWNLINAAGGVLNPTETFCHIMGLGFDNNVRVFYSGGKWLKTGEVNSIKLFTYNGVNVNWDITLFKPKW